MSLGFAIFLGLLVWFVLRCLFSGFYTVDQNQRAVITTFGKARRFGDQTTLDDPISDTLRPDEKERYACPLVHVTQPGLHFKFPWQKVYKVSIATQTVNIAYDPESPAANQEGPSRRSDVPPRGPRPMTGASMRAPARRGASAG